MAVRASVEPSTLATYPGFSVDFQVHVSNTVEVVDAYSIRVLGVDPEWVRCDRDRLQLFPNTVGTFDVRIDLPDDFPGGRRVLTIQVLSELAPTKPTLLALTLDVDVRVRMFLTVEPTLAIVGKNAEFAVTIANNGNAPTRSEFFCEDPEAVEEISFDRPTIELDPGEQRSTTMRVQGKRPWFGQPVTRMLSIGLVDGTPGTERLVTIAHRPRINRLTVSLIGLLLAASVFGIVFSRNLNTVVKSTAIDPALLDQAFGAVKPGLGEAAGTITGTVLARSSSDGIEGATVQLYLASEPSLPVRSVATDSDGVFTIGNLGPGPFRLYAVAGGFDSRWWGDVAQFDNAKDLSIASGQKITDINLLLGGQPATLQGLVVGGAVDGAMVELIAPAESTGGTADAVFQSKQIDAGGLFAFDNIPAPAVYKLRVQRIGSVTSEQTLSLAAGEDRKGVTVQLRSGDGVIGGRVSGPNGALDVPATVVVASSDVTVQTLTLTSGDIGSFRLPGLLTPSTYSVTVSAPGYATQSLTVSLASGQSLTTLAVTLQPATGTVSGVVTLASAPSVRLGAVAVSLTDGETTWTTSTLTNGDDAGTFSFTSIPSPGIYTVTIGGGDYGVVVRNVVLTSLSSVANGITVQLTAALASVNGLVVGADGKPITEPVGVTASDGASSKTVLTATSCPAGAAGCVVGGYRIDGLTPGSYTITYDRKGAEPLVTQQRLAGGENPVPNVQLSNPASLVVTVCSLTTSSGAPTTTTPSIVGGLPCPAGAPTPLSLFSVKLWKATLFPGGATSGAGVSDSNGQVNFPTLETPLQYVVEVQSLANPTIVRTVTVYLVAGQINALTIDVSQAVTP